MSSGILQNAKHRFMKFNSKNKLVIYLYFLRLILNLFVMINYHPYHLCALNVPPIAWSFPRDTRVEPVFRCHFRDRAPVCPVWPLRVEGMQVQRSYEYATLSVKIIVESDML